MERHPSSQEERCSNSRDDKEVEVFCKVEETKVHTRIFCVVSGGELALGLGQVEGTTVGLGRTCYEVNEEGNNGRDMSGEDEPTICCASTIPLIDIVPASVTMVMIESPIESS